MKEKLLKANKNTKNSNKNIIKYIDARLCTYFLSKQCAYIDRREIKIYYQNINELRSIFYQHLKNKRIIYYQIYP